MSPIPPDPPLRLRVSRPEQIIEAVPYLLGFRPSDSVVLVAVDRAELVATARLDLDSVPELIESTVATLCGAGGRELFAVVFDGPPEPAGAGSPSRLRVVRDGFAATDAAPAPSECTDAAPAPSERHDDAERRDGIDAACAIELVRSCEVHGGNLHDVLHVRRGRWRSLLCADEGCCPPQGQPLPAAPSAFAAEATYRGMVALPDRDALAAQLAPLPDADRLIPLIAAAETDVALAGGGGSAEVFAAAQTRQRRLTRQLFAAARAGDAPTWTPPDDEQAARWLVGLADIGLRDAVWLAVDDGRIDGRALWSDLARRAPGLYAAPPLFLLGWAAWRAGMGALANIAVARAVECDPRYSAADLLTALLDRGVDPRAFPPLGRARNRRRNGGVRARPRPA